MSNVIEEGVKRAWWVQVPVVANVGVEVVAETEKEAIDAAIQKIYDLEEKATLFNPASTVEVSDWEAHKIVAQGNYYHGCINEAEAEEV